MKKKKSNSEQLLELAKSMNPVVTEVTYYGGFLSATGPNGYYAYIGNEEIFLGTTFYQAQTKITQEGIAEYNLYRNHHRTERDRIDKLFPRNN